MMYLALKTIVLLFLTMLGWWWLSLPLSIYLAWQTSVLPIISIAVLMDAYSGRFFTIPLLSIGAVMVVIIINIMKSKSLLYNQDNEVV